MSSGERDPHLVTTRLPSGEGEPPEGASGSPSPRSVDLEALASDGTVLARRGAPVDAPAVGTDPTLIAGSGAPRQSLIEGTDETIIAADRAVSSGPDTEELARQLAQRRAGVEPQGTPQRIGRYRVLHRLGEGGMGTVFAARDDELDRKVAIKLVRAQLHGEDARATARLLREAKSLAKISHPNVIHVYEVGTWQGQVFVAMEFVDGWTLSQFQYRNVSTWEDLLELYKAAGRGLAAAHRGGLVHRDFKPDNVLVTRRGDVRVIDFGLARTILEEGEEAEGPAPREIADADLMQLTRTGAVMGTPAYMAPEQHEGKPTDARTDQFSFCVSLYEALYAQRPFAGDTLAQLTVNVLEGKVSDPPPFIRVPSWIRRVLLKGLSVDPARRYEDMPALLSALDHDPARVRRLLVGAGSVLGVAAIALMSWRGVVEAREQRAAAAHLRAEFDEARLLDAEARIQAARARSLAQRQDDLVLAYARDALEEDPGRALAALKHLNPSHEGWVPQARAIATEALGRGVEELVVEAVGGPPTGVAFAPSGERVAIAGTDGRVALIELIDGRLSRLDRVSAPAGPLVFTASGSHLVVGDAEGRLHVFERGQTHPAQVIQAHEGAVTALAAAPAGDRVASGGADSTVGLWRVEAGIYERRLLDHEAQISALVFGAGEDLLFTADATGKLYRRALGARQKIRLEQSLPVRSLHLSGGTLLGLDDGGMLHEWAVADGEHRVLEEGVSSFASRGAARVSARRDGVLRVERAGQTDRVLRGLPTDLVALAVAPDLSRVVLATGGGGVRVRRLGDESQLRRFGDDDAVMDELALAHRGTLVATADASGAVSVHDVRSGSSFALPEGLQGRADRLAFGPLDHRLLGFNGRTWRMWRLDAERGSIRLADAECHATALSWSPDHQTLAVAQCPTSTRVERYDRDGRHLGRTWVPRPIQTMRFNRAGNRLLSTDGEALVHTSLADQRSQELPRGARGVGDTELLAFAFDEDGDGVRVATRRGPELYVWHWAPGSDRVALLSEETLGGTMRSDREMAHLLVALDGGLLRFWDLEHNHTELIAGVEGRLVELAVSSDRSTVLVSSASEDGAPRVHQVELESGAIRVFDDPVPFTRISGTGEVLARRFEGVVETWLDPTPADPGRFLDWIDTQTLLEIPAQALLDRE